MIFQIPARSYPFGLLLAGRRAQQLHGASIPDVGFSPCWPLVTYHGERHTQGAVAGSTGRRRIQIEILQPPTVQKYLVLRIRARVMARLRSVSTSMSMPSFFHCCLIISAHCVNGMNCAPSVVTSTRSRPLPSVRSRKPSLSFLVNPTLSSSSLACLTSRVAHFFRYSFPGS